MKSFVNKQIRELPPSGIRKYFDLASSMKDVVSLGVGEPDFYTPWNIREEAIYALEHKRTVYSSNAGILELRKEISKYMNRRFGLKYKAETQVLVSVGASEDIDLVMRAVLEPGDEVLLAEPCFVSYKACIQMAGGVPVIITTKAENKFRLTKEELLSKITDKTKILFIGYPNNPTGAIMEKEDLEEIAQVLRDRDILVVSDEIYAELTYGGKEHVSIASLPGMYEKTLVINGFSKAFSMTGWRLGFACGPEDLIDAMTKIHQYIIMCAPTVSQYAAIEALRSGDASVTAMRKEFDARRRFMLKGFADIGLDCFEPEGAFYLFPSIQKTGLSSDEFCDRLLREEKLAVVPGTAFGECGDGFIRCSYAYSIDNLKEALVRLGRFVSK